MKKGILILVVIIAVLFGAIYYFSVAGEKSAYKIKVYIWTEGNLTQGNVTATRLGELENVYSSQVLGPNVLSFPGMTVGLLEVSRGRMVSSWRHGPYNGTGKYEIELDVKRDFKEGETIRVIHYIYDAKEKLIYSGVRDFVIKPKDINVKQNNT